MKEVRVGGVKVKERVRRHDVVYKVIDEYDPICRKLAKYYKD